MATVDTTDVETSPGATTEQPGADLSAERISLPNYPDVRIGPLGHLEAERARLASLRWEHFEVRPLAATVGGELTGVDITVDLADEVIAEIRQALHDYKVIFFRDQPLTPARHVAFARRFGELEIHPFIPGNAEAPELVRFEKSADVGGYENGWHHDVTWRAEPSFGAVLHAVSVPRTGGDTLFSDQYAAHEGLDDATKAEIDDLVAVHNYTLAFGHNLPPEEKAKMRADYPLVEHPVVARHAETGRRHLYVNRYFTSHIEGYEPQASIDLIDRLAKQAEIAEYQVRFHWEPHSVAFWDNRAVQHYAASDYWPDVRIMERASILGTRPSP